jgi:opacity protein-like surface antigen
LRCHLPCKLAPVILATLLCGTTDICAAAADTRAQLFSFSGFGTLGAVHSSESQADFSDNPFKPNGAGYTRPWSLAVDSRIGGQVTAHFNTQLSAVVQVISEQLSDNTYRPHVEWANVKYQFTPEFSVRLGRTVLSSFLFADTRKVGYANPWVRPPVELYNLVPVTNSDGVDLTYTARVGEFVHTLVATYGGNNPGLPASLGGGTARVRSLWVLCETIEYGYATVHITYEQAHVTVPAINVLPNAFRQFGPEGVALADKYNQDDKLIDFTGVSAMYNPGRWFLLGEWGRDNLHSVLGASTAWYVTGGHRISQLTPYLTYSVESANSNRSDPGLTLSTLPPALVAPATGLNAALNTALASVTVQRTISAGARWDVMQNVALKLQYDHSRLGAGSPGVLLNPQAGFKPGGTVNLFSVAADFVF